MKRVSAFNHLASTFLLLSLIVSGMGITPAQTVYAAQHAAAFTSCGAVTEIPLAECEALVALFNSTNGPGWTNNTNWLQTDTPCSWYGVNCQGGNNVNSVMLNNNQLSGSIPNEIGGLTAMQFLSLYLNQLSGPIPTKIGDLAALLTINLSSNQLTGAIPQEIEKLTLLQTLSIGDNQLSGSIPAWIGTLTALQSLDLSSNRLSGSIPLEIGNLSELNGLYLSINQLSGNIPSEIGALAKLQYLNLAYNQLNGEIPSGIGNLTLLYWLYLNNNQLSGGIPPGFGNLTKLEWSDLSFNQLNGNIPSGIGNLTKLKLFGLAFNQLNGGIPQEIGNLNALEWLYLNNNQLTGEIPPSITNLINLQSLSLSCGLTSTNSNVIIFIDGILGSGWDDPCEGIKIPVVFVHGWLGASLPPVDCISNHVKYEQPISWSEAKAYFQGVGDQLKTDGGYSDGEIVYAQLVSNACFTPSLDENVPNLMAAIDQAKAATGQSKVILIAHSMGGLVSRAYIEGSQYRGDVEALFSFGSPHKGTPEDGISFLLNGMTFGSSCVHYQAAACDFSILGMQLFNLYHHKNLAVTYHVISGDAPFLSRNAFGKAMDVLILGPDDGAVPAYSGRAEGLGAFDRWTTDETHGPGNSFSSHTYFIGDSQAGASYADCIRKVLVDGAQNCGTVSAKSLVRQDIPAAMSQHTPFEHGSLSSGQSATSNISIEGGPTLFVAQWQNGTLAFTLIDPAGQPINLAYANEHPDLVTYSTETGAEAYYFPNAIPGDWQTQLQAVDVPTGNASYTSFASFDSNVTLTASIDHEWYAPNATATVTATLGGSPIDAMVTAKVNRPDGSSDPLTLVSIGEGQYQATYTVPNISGYADIQLTASGTTASSLAFERGASLVFQISPDTFVLSSSYEAVPIPYPGLSAYQFLNINVGINAAADGRVGVSADLVDGSGHFVAHASAIQDVTTGVLNLTLPFSGTDIFTSKLNGPYTLTNVFLTDVGGSTLITQQATSVFTTPSYLYINFDHTPPGVLSVTRENTSPTSKASVKYKVTFDEAVSGVDINDFALTRTGTLGGFAVSNVSGSDAFYIVTVTTGTGNGTLRLDMANNGTIKDLTNNPLAAGFTTGEVYSIKKEMAFPSSAILDGWILESTSTSGKGGSLDSKAITINIGDNKEKKQYRSMLSFDTTALPDTAIITAVTLKFKSAGIQGGGNPVTIFGGFMVDIRKGPFGSFALALTDFNATPTRTLGTFKVSPASGWYAINLVKGAGFLNKLGLTQIRLRFNLEDNGNVIDNYLRIYSGNAPVASRPQLIVRYYVP